MEKWLYSLLLTSVFASCVGFLAVKLQKNRITYPAGQEVERATSFLRLALLLLFLPFPILNESLAKLLSLPWLWIVWAGGALVVLGLFLFSHGAEAKRARLTLVTDKNSMALKVLSEAGKRVGVAPPPLWEGEVERPVMTLFRLIIPAGTIDEGKLLCYFCRLLVLRRKYVILFFYLWRFAVILHWFNPLVWFMAKTDQLWSAEECDRMALWFLPDQYKPLYKDLFSKEKTRNLTFFMD